MARDGTDADGTDASSISNDVRRVEAIGRRRMNPVTGAVEYLTFCDDGDEPTWESDFALYPDNATAMMRADAQVLRQLATSADEVVPLDPLHVRKIMNRSDPAAADTTPLSSSSIMFDLIESSYVARLRNLTLPALSSAEPEAVVRAFQSPAVEAMRAAIVEISDDELRSLPGVRVIGPAAYPSDRSNAKHSTPGPPVGGAHRRLSRSLCSIVGQAPCRVGLQQPLAGWEVDSDGHLDDKIEILALKKNRTPPSITVTLKEPLNKRRRTESEIAENGESIPEYPTQFVVEYTRGSDSVMECPLAEFRLRYPEPLIHFLVRHAFLYPLP